MRMLMMFLFAAAAGWAGEDPVRTAVEKSLARLQSSGVEFGKKTGCISCHHQSLTAMAVSAARDRGFAVNEADARQQVKLTMSVVAPHRETMMQAVPTIPATTIVSTYGLIGLAAEKVPADDSIAALVFELAGRQEPDGRWRTEALRPPLDQGDGTATALTLRSLQLYPLAGRKQEFAERVKRAARWLARFSPSTTQEKAMRVMGLAWAGTERAAMNEAAQQLLKEQRPDGGWAQLPNIDSDAYATGQVLYALHLAGVTRPDGDAYRKGTQFLLANQAADGTWHVKSRALGFQKYFESGYPHGHDQWISVAGGAWATLALALTREPAMAMR